MVENKQDENVYMSIYAAFFIGFSFANIIWGCIWYFTH